MTDTTAPRTVAGPIVPCPWCGGEGYDNVYLDLSRGEPGVSRHGDCGNDVGTDFIEAVIARWQAEAIEPLLALVRAAQEWLAVDDEPFVVEDGGNVEAQWADFDARIDAAVTATRAALAALPESVRVAARKPE